MRKLAWLVVSSVVMSALPACASDDQRLESDGARAARDARSEVATVRLVAGSYLDGKLWKQPAARMISDAESAVGTVSANFAAQQPTTGAGQAAYERFSTALDAAADVVAEVRIAVANEDRPLLRRRLQVLDGNARQLAVLGESAK